MAKTKYKEKEDGPRRPEPVARDGAYVMMLFITLVAIAAGCVLMYLDKDEYGGKTPPKEAVTIQKLGSEFKSDAAPAGPAGPGGGGPAVPMP